MTVLPSFCYVQVVLTSWLQYTYAATDHNSPCLTRPWYDLFANMDPLFLCIVVVVAFTYKILISTAPVTSTWCFTPSHQYYYYCSSHQYYHYCSSYQYYYYCSSYQCYYYCSSYQCYYYCSSYQCYYYCSSYQYYHYCQINWAVKPMIVPSSRSVIVSVLASIVKNLHFHWQAGINAFVCLFVSLLVFLFGFPFTSALSSLSVLFTSFCCHYR